MNPDNKLAFSAPHKAHHLVTGENPRQNAVLTLLDLWVSVSICG
jgi:hypothetical protein